MKTKSTAPNIFLFSIALLLFVFAGGACSNAVTETGGVKAASESEPAAAVDGELEKARRYVEKMPDSPKGYVDLAAVYIKRARENGDFGLNAKAETAVDKALALAPDDFAARRLKASLHLTFHRFPEAREMGRRLAAEYPDDAFAYGVLADANAELGDYEAAVAAAQQMVDRRPNMASYARVAHLRALYGDTAGAVEMYKTAARTADPADREAQSWCLVQLGDVLWRSGRYAEAEKVYREALGILPNYHLALAGAGRARAAEGDFDGALRLLNAANERVPDAETAALIGDLHTKKGEKETAAQFYRLVEVIEGRSADGGDRRRVALLWADRGERLEEALSIARRVAESRRDIYTMDALAWTLYKNGQFIEAKRAARESLRLGTRDARLLFHAGMIEKSLNNRAEAKRLLQSALELNPQFDLIQTEIARQALDALNR